MNKGLLAGCCGWSLGLDSRKENEIHFLFYLLNIICKSVDPCPFLSTYLFQSRAWVSRVSILWKGIFCFWNLWLRGGERPSKIARYFCIDRVSTGLKFQIEHFAGIDPWNTVSYRWDYFRNLFLVNLVEWLLVVPYIAKTWRSNYIFYWANPVILNIHFVK